MVESTRTELTRPGRAGVAARPIDVTLVPPSSPPTSLLASSGHHERSAHHAYRHRHGRHDRGEHTPVTTLQHQSDRHTTALAKSHRHAQPQTSIGGLDVVSESRKASFTSLEKAISCQTGKIDRLQEALEQMSERVAQELIAVRAANNEKIKHLSDSLHSIMRDILDTTRSIRAERGLKQGADSGQCLWSEEWGEVQGGGVGDDTFQAGFGVGQGNVLEGVSQFGGSSGFETFVTADDRRNEMEVFEGLGLTPGELSEMQGTPHDQSVNPAVLDADFLHQLFNVAAECGIGGDTQSLNSGVEPLPSDCTRTSSVQPSVIDCGGTGIGPNLHENGGLRSGGPERSPRGRGKHSRLHGGHPTDPYSRKIRREDRAAMAARTSHYDRVRSGSAASLGSHRDIRGRSALPPIKLDLPPSSGPKDATGVKWLAHGPNTMAGRLEEISCDECHGRTHWACAGLSAADKMLNEPWACPDCIHIRRREEGQSPVRIKQAQQERCIRPDCIISYKPMISSWDDGDRFQIDRIVGRRRVSRNGSSKRTYEYLVKWKGWDWKMYDCTWEPPRNIPDLPHWEDKFKADARKAGVDLVWKVAMLPITEQYWDSKGHLKLDRLEEEGVELKEWMFDHRLKQ